MNFSFPIAVAVVAISLPFATVTRAEMNSTEDRLLRDLLTKNSFNSLFQPNDPPKSLTFKGRTSPGPIEWGLAPDEYEIRPVAMKGHVANNCETDAVLTVSDHLQDEYKETSSWEVTGGFEVGWSVEAEGKLPVLGSGKVGKEVKISVSASTGGKTTTTLKVRSGYSVVVPPQREMDVQLQVIEQVIEGTPFKIEVELIGDATIATETQSYWVPYVKAEGLPAGIVIAGEERKPNGDWRDLVVCKSGDGHPGKIVEKICHYGYDGDERGTSDYYVLSVPGAQYEWMDHKDFEDAFSQREIAEGRADVFYGVKESREGRYNGRTFVCRAKYRGNMHSGKMVDNHCMFPYGGKERQRRNYDVLVRTGDAGLTKTIRLEDHLSRAERTMVVEGEFDSARALSASTVLGKSRPVDPAACGGGVVTDVGTTIRDVQIERDAPITVQGGNASTSSSGGRGDDAPDRPKVDLLADGTPLAQVSLETDDAPVELVSRRLHLTSPRMFGSDVLAVQQALTEAGWPLLQDGYYGTYTARAVRAFQKAHRLDVDGVFGPMTQAMLGL